MTTQDTSPQETRLLVLGDVHFSETDFLQPAEPSARRRRGESDEHSLLEQCSALYAFPPPRRTWVVEKLLQHLLSKTFTFCGAGDSDDELAQLGDDWNVLRAKHR